MAENVERQCEELAAALAIFEDAQVCLGPAGAFEASAELRDSLEDDAEETAALLKGQLLAAAQSAEEEEEKQQGTVMLHLRVRIDLGSSSSVLLTLSLPPQYPSSAAPGVELDAPAWTSGTSTAPPPLPPAAIKMIVDAIASDASDKAACGGECVVELAQRAKDLCRDMLEFDAAAEERERAAMVCALAEMDAEASIGESMAALPSSLSAAAAAAAVAGIEAAQAAKTKRNAKSKQTLGRRCLFMHHIIADSKRRACLEWAVRFGLCGASKIGWPGVVVVEGPEEGCKAYVSALQRLRWKQCVVRGEQQEEVESIDMARKFPDRGMREFGQKEMSAMAAYCDAAGLSALFKASMKIKA